MKNQSKNYGGVCPQRKEYLSMRLKDLFKVAAVVVTMSLTMIITAGGYLTARSENELNVKCATEVSTEKWEINRHITTFGNVNGDAVEKVCEIIKTQVPSEAWNFLVNSGGQIIIVEGNDIKEFIVDRYKCDVSKIKEGDDIQGYCHKFNDINAFLSKVDIVIASECIQDSLLHEFCHALDYSHNYSQTDKFLKIFNNADEIMNILNLSDKAKAYYGGDIEEFYAEMMSLYLSGEIVGVDITLETYLQSTIN